MKILLFGKYGKLGWELQRALSPLAEIVALGRETEGGIVGDMTQLAELANTVRVVNPDFIVNAAAYTDVDRAEQEVELARLVNAEAPKVLASEARKIGATLVHYSTDYVFDGNGEEAWRECDPTKPLNIYGETKLDGENAVRSSDCSYLILRTSWIYANRGKSFLRTILNLAKERDVLQVIDDQFGAPTGAELVADVTAQILPSFQRDNGLGGTYHLTASGETSWHGYARFLIQNAREKGWAVQVNDDSIQAINSEGHITPAVRPRNSRLNCKKLEQTFGLRMPNWSIGVLRTLEEVGLHPSRDVSC